MRIGELHRRSRFTTPPAAIGRRVRQFQRPQATALGIPSHLLSNMDCVAVGLDPAYGLHQICPRCRPSWQTTGNAPRMKPSARVLNTAGGDLHPSSPWLSSWTICVRGRNGMKTKFARWKRQSVTYWHELSPARHDNLTRVRDHNDDSSHRDPDRSAADWRSQGDHPGLARCGAGVGTMEWADAHQPGGARSFSSGACRRLWHQSPRWPGSRTIRRP